MRIETAGNQAKEKPCLEEWRKLFRSPIDLSEPGFNVDMFARAIVVSSHVEIPAITLRIAAKISIV